ncbi:hypothetical protein JW926_07455, partial [Candidatus Sumerlaeota bacterium]|nr:hypothetical protein [Candidatus Sumerlaeota bacterium]
MKIIFSFLSFLFLVAGYSHAASDYIYSSPVDNQDPIDQALFSIGLNRDACVFPLSGSAISSDKRFECPSYRLFLYNPFHIPYYASHIEYNFECYRDNLLRTMIFMSSRAGGAVARGYFTKPLASIEQRLENAESPLLSSLEEIWALNKLTMSSEEKDAISSAIRDVPDKVRFETARLLFTTTQAVHWQRKALKSVIDSDHRGLLENIPGRLTPLHFGRDKMRTITEEWERERYSDLRPLTGLVDDNYIFCGALDLMNSLEKTRANLSEELPPDEFHAAIETPLGFVVLNGAGQDNHYKDDRDYLLIVDFGGNDVYNAGGGCESAVKPVSILLDFSGNDAYVHTSSGLKALFGAGITGYGFLFDFRGDDKYISPQLTQGCGFFGVGWLVDFEGDDIYESLRYSQGFAHGGAGFLYDLQGDDVYFTFNSSQGCGETRGCGMLVDEQGNDQYIADDEDIRFPSAQTPKHNRSIAQGIGIGERADELDGHSLPGGIGILIDKQGDDKYSAGVYAQGAGFWNGVGILIDSNGNDEYKGAWYVQGAGIHGGVGSLNDRDGNDTYTATLHAAQGIGHDYAIGFFVDEKGNDAYFSPRLSLGTANENSL